jgi:hypothetical protein
MNAFLTISESNITKINNEDLIKKYLMINLCIQYQLLIILIKIYNII